MKKVIILYFEVLLLCFVFGGIVAAGIHYSWAFLLFLLIPISLVIVLWKNLLREMNNHLMEHTIMVAAIFVMIMVGLVIAAVYSLDETSFIGTMYSAFIGGCLLFVFPMMMKLPKKWAIWKRKMRRFSY
jgi:asparagine N-glycosylation enzyme membrane subunit Stt3